jgi:hypothetical protein
MNRWLSLMTLVLLTVALIAAGVAIARPSNGGNSIASAPSLPLGQTVASGWSENNAVANTCCYGELWRVQLGAGDKLVVDWAQTQTSCGNNGQMLIWSPAVTDFTLSNTQPVADLGANDATKFEFGWIAPGAGNWTVMFSDCAQTSYTFNAIIQTFTTTTLTPPPTLVSAGAKVRVRGTVTSARSGKVLVVVSGPKGFKRLGKVVPLRGGVFAVSLKLTKQGLYHFKVTFPGDAAHRPSTSRTYAVRVAT